MTAHYDDTEKEDVAILLSRPELTLLHDLVRDSQIGYEVALNYSLASPDIPHDVKIALEQTGKRSMAMLQNIHRQLCEKILQ